MLRCNPRGDGRQRRCGQRRLAMCRPGCGVAGPLGQGRRCDCPQDSGRHNQGACAMPSGANPGAVFAEDAELFGLARRQGSLAGAPSLDLTAEVTGRALAERHLAVNGPVIAGCEPVPGDISKEVVAAQATSVRRGGRPSGAVTLACCEFAAEFPADLRRIGAQMRDAKKRLAVAARVGHPGHRGIRRWTGRRRHRDRLRRRCFCFASPYRVGGVTARAGARGRPGRRCVYV